MRLAADLHSHYRFQSRSGFSGRLDLVASLGILAVALFQSRSGFSGRLDLKALSEPQKETLFQSRSGFSGRLDGRCTIGVPRIASSFNPVLGFLVVSTAGATATGDLSVFQSRSGFSGRLDSAISARNSAFRVVSIPFWVFWSSRPVGVD